MSTFPQNTQPGVGHPVVMDDVQGAVGPAQEGPVIAAIPNPQGGTLVIRGPVPVAQPVVPMQHQMNAPVAPAPVPVYNPNVPPPPIAVPQQPAEPFRPAGPGDAQYSLPPPIPVTHQANRPQFMSASETQVMAPQAQVGFRFPQPHSAGSLGKSSDTITFPDVSGQRIDAIIHPEDLPEIRAMILQKVMMRQMAGGQQQTTQRGLGSNPSIGSLGSAGSGMFGSGGSGTFAHQPSYGSMDAQTIQRYILMMIQNDELDPDAAHIMQLELQLYEAKKKAQGKRN